jgi:hypothetical protein
MADTVRKRTILSRRSCLLRWPRCLERMAGHVYFYSQIATQMMLRGCFVHVLFEESRLPIEPSKRSESDFSTSPVSVFPYFHFFCAVHYSMHALFMTIAGHCLSGCLFVCLFAFYACTHVYEFVYACTVSTATRGVFHVHLSRLLRAEVVIVSEKEMGDGHHRRAGQCQRTACRGRSIQHAADAFSRSAYLSAVVFLTATFVT